MEVLLQAKWHLDHPGSVECLAFSPDGKLLASGGDDPYPTADETEGLTSIRLWDTADFGEPFIHPGHTGRVYSLAFSPNGRLLASCGGGSIVRLYHLDSRGVTGNTSFSGWSNSIWAVAFSPDGRLLASSGFDQIIHLWKLTSPIPEKWAVLEKTGGPVCFSPNGKLLATGSEDAAVMLFEVHDNYLSNKAKLEGHTTGVSSLAFSPDGRLLASSSDDGTVRLWSVTDLWRFQAVLRGMADFPGAIAFHPNGQYLFAGDSEGLRGWSLTGPEFSSRELFKGSHLYSLAISQDGEYLAVGSQRDKVISIHSIQTDS